MKLLFLQFQLKLHAAGRLALAALWSHHNLFEHLHCQNPVQFMLIQSLKTLRPMLLLPSDTPLTTCVGLHAVDCDWLCCPTSGCAWCMFRVKSHGFFRFLSFVVKHADKNSVEALLPRRTLTRVQHEKMHIGSISGNKHDWPERAEDGRSQCPGAECGKSLLHRKKLINGPLLGLSAPSCICNCGNCEQGIGVVHHCMMSQGTSMLQHPPDEEPATDFASRKDTMFLVEQTEGSQCIKIIKLLQIFDSKHKMAPSKNDPRSLDVVRPKDVPRGRVRCEKEYQQAHWITLAIAMTCKNIQTIGLVSLSLLQRLDTICCAQAWPLDALVHAPSHQDSTHLDI